MPKECSSPCSGEHVRPHAILGHLYLKAALVGAKHPRRRLSGIVEGLRRNASSLRRVRRAVPATYARR